MAYFQVLLLVSGSVTTEESSGPPNVHPSGIRTPEILVDRQEFNNGELELGSVNSMCFKFADGSITDDTGSCQSG